MGKKLWDIDAASAAGEVLTGSGNRYDGPLPPQGLYPLKFKMLRLVLNRNKDYMLKVLHEIEAPAGDKRAQYNGYGTWNNLNVTSTGAKWVNNFLDAHGFEAQKAAFWRGDALVVDDDDNVTKIGTKRVKLDVIVLGDLRKEKGSGEYDDKMVPAMYFERSASGEEEPTSPVPDTGWDTPVDADGVEDEPEPADGDEDEGAPEVVEESEEDEETEDVVEGEVFDRDARITELSAFDRDGVKALLLEYKKEDPESGLKVLKSDTAASIVEKIVDYEQTKFEANLGVSDDEESDEEPDPRGEPPF